MFYCFFGFFHDCLLRLFMLPFYDEWEKEAAGWRRGSEGSKRERKKFIFIWCDFLRLWCCFCRYGALWKMFFAFFSAKQWPMSVFTQFLFNFAINFCRGINAITFNSFAFVEKKLTFFLIGKIFRFYHFQIDKKDKRKFHQKLSKFDRNLIEFLSKIWSKVWIEVWQKLDRFLIKSLIESWLTIWIYFDWKFDQKNHRNLMKSKRL